MKEKIYSKNDFIIDLKKYSSKFKDNKDDFNKLFHSHLIFLEYMSSSKQMKPAIICSFKPLVKLFLTAQKYKNPNIRIILNKLNEKTKSLSNKSKKISTFNFIFKEVVSLPIDNIKIYRKIELNLDNIEEIILEIKRISKIWDEDNPIKRRFS